MKYLKFLTIIGFLAGFIFVMGCNNDGGDEPTPEEKQLEKLLDGWNLTSASLDSDDRTSDWTGMTLSMTTTKSYSTTGSADNEVWPASGTFDFQSPTDAGLDVLIRSDGVTVNIDAVSEVDASPRTLTLSFDFVLARPHMNERTQSIEGHWVFSFQHQ